MKSRKTGLECANISPLLILLMTMIMMIAMRMLTKMISQPEHALQIACCRYTCRQTQALCRAVNRTCQCTIKNLLRRCAEQTLSTKRRTLTLCNSASQVLLTALGRQQTPDTRTCGHFLQTFQGRHIQLQITVSWSVGHDRLNTTLASSTVLQTTKFTKKNFGFTKLDWKSDLFAFLMENTNTESLSSASASSVSDLCRYSFILVMVENMFLFKYSH